MTNNAGDPIRLPAGAEVTGLIPVPHQKDASQAKPGPGKRRGSVKPKARPPAQADQRDGKGKPAEGTIDYLA